MYLDFSKKNHTLRRVHMTPELLCDVMYGPGQPSGIPEPQPEQQRKHQSSRYQGPSRLRKRSLPSQLSDLESSPLLQESPRTTTTRANSIEATRGPRTRTAMFGSRHDGFSSFDAYERRGRHHSTFPSLPGTLSRHSSSSHHDQSRMVEAHHRQADRLNNQTRELDRVTREKEIFCKRARRRKVCAYLAICLGIPVAATISGVTAPIVLDRAVNLGSALIMNAIQGCKGQCLDYMKARWRDDPTVNMELSPKWERAVQAWVQFCSQRPSKNAPQSVADSGVIGLPLPPKGNQFDR